jgi:hypothetical protein
MRELFESARDILAYYRFLKANVVSIPAIIPKKADTWQSSKFNAVLARSNREERLAFIGDVENFVKYYHGKQTGYVKVPMDCLFAIFTHRFCSHHSRFMSFGELANHFKHRISRGEPLPRRVCYRQHLQDIASDMEKRSEEYFVSKGMITPKECTNL